MAQEMDTLVLRAPRAAELTALTDLCLRSKAVWGYDRAFMEACRVELTLTQEDLRETVLQVAERDGAIVGMAQISAEGGTGYLDKLFIEPGQLRAGAGRTLFAWARTAAAKLGATRLVIEADPDAAPFYRRMGARDDGTAPSGSIPGRVLPRLVLPL
ncbi:MAG: GNAT family N-acetyltransferase [Alphaproteobacteria bacterium]|jgi:GNAT superfamily N-acetyltransferase|nr:GNAT family N-acetyltransferase [Alphaproteobacteria bacterium]